MHDELTNLLPEERQRALAHNYYLRLAVVGVLMLTALILAAAALLFPSYVFLVQSEKSKEDRLAVIESAPQAADGQSLSDRLAALSANAATLVALERAPPVSSTVREMLAVPRPGVSLSGFSYVPASGKKPGTLTVTGIAATRDALRNYQLALQSAAFVRSADLPVSAYAKDSKVPFIITITIAI